nr:LOW QUALITY PROTEIN: regulatory protein zeste-like [Cherax quadricarinatus]
MAEEQTDWLACGRRRCRAQRVAEVVAAREEQYQANLHLRRCRLRVLLQEEAERQQQELRTRARLLHEQQHAARVEAAAAALDQQEQQRLQLVQLADEHRRRLQCHEYREAYRKRSAAYEESRAIEVTLRNQKPKQYGVPLPPGKKP